MKLQINVTQELIDQGVKRDCLMCPFALASCKAVEHTKYWFVASLRDRLRLITPSGTDCDIMYPRRAIDWIQRYDDDKKVRPISFELDTDKGFAVAI